MNPKQPVMSRFTTTLQ